MGLAGGSLGGGAHELVPLESDGCGLAGRVPADDRAEAVDIDLGPFGSSGKVNPVFDGLPAAELFVRVGDEGAA